MNWNNSNAPNSRGLGGLGILEPLMTILHLVEFYGSPRTTIVDVYEMERDYSCQMSR